MEAGNERVGLGLAVEGLQAVAADALGALARHYVEHLAANPELAGTPETAALLASPAMVDVYNSWSALSEPQRVQEAYNQALLKVVNGTLNQAAESQAMQRGHGIYLP